MAKDNRIKKHFFKELKEELKRVKWPTPKELVKSTVAVISIVLLIALIVFALDTGFNLLNAEGVNKIKRHIVETVNKPEETVGTEGGTDENVEDDTTDEDTNTETTTEPTTEPTEEQTEEPVTQ
jgi:preprotein translocase subunit SecE